MVHFLAEYMLRYCGNSWEESDLASAWSSPRKPRHRAQCYGATTWFPTAWLHCR